MSASLKQLICLFPVFLKIKSKFSLKTEVVFSTQMFYGMNLTNIFLNLSIHESLKSRLDFVILFVFMKYVHSAVL